MVGTSVGSRRARRAWHAGIDIGGSRVRLVTDYWGAGPDGVGAGGRRVQYADIPGSYEELLKVTGELMVRAVTGDVAKTGNEPVPPAPAESPSAVACGLPGTSDGSRTKFMPALPWLDDKPLAADLADMLGAPVTLANDGHLTLLAEARDGAAVGRDSAVLVAVGTGIGGAMMLGGKVWRGHHGSGGAWGWLPHTGAADDPAGRLGQFEQAASGRALDRAAAALSGDLDGGSVARQGRDLVLAARAGDPSAVAAVRSYAAELGRGVAAIASVIDPEIVLIGGGLSAVMDLLQPVIERTMAGAASPDGRTIPVRAAALGPAGGVIGAWHAARGGTEIWL